MSVDLSNLIDSLKREVQAPGDNLFPNATDDDWLGNLTDAFWEGVMEGFLLQYTCDNNGIVTPLNVSTADIGRDLQQVIIFIAGIRIIRNTLRNLKTTFIAKAGNVEYETQQAATILTQLLDELNTRFKIILFRLSDVGIVPAYVIDGYMARDDAIHFGDTFWISG